MSAPYRYRYFKIFKNCPVNKGVIKIMRAYNYFIKMLTGPVAKVFEDFLCFVVVLSYKTFIVNYDDPGVEQLNYSFLK